MREYLEPRMRPVDNDNIINLVNDEFRNFQHLFQQNRQQCIQRFADANSLPGLYLEKLFSKKPFFILEIYL